MTREEAKLLLIRPTVTSNIISETKAREIEAYNMAIEALQADRPHGEWVKQNNELKISEYQCSECGHYQDDESNFCPNCGTRMYKGGDDE